MYVKLYTCSLWSNRCISDGTQCDFRILIFTRSEAEGGLLFLQTKQQQEQVTKKFSE